MWPFYPYLNAKSGVTPPYAKTPQGSSWPYYTGNGGGTKLPVPYSPKPMAPLGGAGLPVPTTAPGLPVPTGGAGLPVPSGGAGLPALSGHDPMQLNALDMARQLVSKLGSGGGGSLLSRVLGPLGMLLGSTSPAGDANDNGQGELLKQPTFPNGVPMPQPRPGNPYGTGVSVPDNPFVGGGAAPQASPYQRASDVGAMAQGNPYPAAAAPAPSFYNGPGSMSFGAGDAAPGAMGSQPQTDLLSMLIKKLQQGN